MNLRASMLHDNRPPGGPIVRRRDAIARSTIPAASPAPSTSSAKPLDPHGAAELIPFQSNSAIRRPDFSPILREARP